MACTPSRYGIPQMADLETKPCPKCKKLMILTCETTAKFENGEDCWRWLCMCGASEEPQASYFKAGTTDWHDDWRVANGENS